MGKVGGFLECRREEPGYRSVTERLRDWRAVELLPTPELASAQAGRCMDCGTPFCHGFGCPVRNFIPEINDLVCRHRWRDALELLLAQNNFPEFTGRICPALCEAACVLSINDQPVTIRQIELAVIEKAFQDGYLQPRQPQRRRSERIAVIGAGPAGLAAADTLNHAGFNVTVFDGDHQPGGILRYGIPDFKLEKHIIDRRVRLMEAEGVRFEMRAAVGEDVSARYLLDRFQVICLAGGARCPRDLKVPGRELSGVHFALDFLIGQNLRVAGAPVPPEMDIHAGGKSVVIIGGGDTGADCLGTALRHGAKDVVQIEIMPEPPLTRDPATPWPLWPRMLRKSSSHLEGGRRLWGVQTVGFEGSAGKVKAVRCVRVECKIEKGKGLIFTPINGTEFELPADLVLLALGFAGAVRSKLADSLQLVYDARGNLAVNADCQTNHARVFAAGDVAHGATLVVHAIQDGRRAAAGIMRRFV